MPAMPAVPSPPPRPWVAEDLDQMPDDGYRREIVNGVLIVTPSPIGRHQRLLFLLATRLEAATAEFIAMVAPYDWRPLGGDSLQPDVMVIRGTEFDLDGLHRLTPALVVEVLSPSSIEYDRAVKRAAYERLGVPAYWIADPAVPNITVLQLDRRGCYHEVGTAAGGECLTVDLPFPFRVIPSDLLRV